MTDSDATLQSAVREAHRQVESIPVPAFEKVWAAASGKAAATRRRRFLLAGAVAAAVMLAIAIGLRAPVKNEWLYLDELELLETTGWSAPSDSLLPAREFDIYQDIPVLIESTETYGGALL